MDDYGFRPYLSVRARRKKAERDMERLRKKGHPVSPVLVARRAIARRRRATPNRVCP